MPAHLIFHVGDAFSFGGLGNDCKRFSLTGSRRCKSFFKSSKLLPSIVMTSKPKASNSYQWVRGLLPLLQGPSICRPLLSTMTQRFEAHGGRKQTSQPPKPGPLCFPRRPKRKPGSFFVQFSRQRHAYRRKSPAPASRNSCPHLGCLSCPDGPAALLRYGGASEARSQQNSRAAVKVE